MKTVMIDGKEVVVDDEMTGQEITELANPSAEQFAVIKRPGPTPQRFPVQKSTHNYKMQNNDVLDTMYRVPMGGGVHSDHYA